MRTFSWLTSAALASMLTLAATTWVAMAQLGPLDPPDGPLQDTAPSLSTLSQQIASLERAINDDKNGPWQVQVITPGTGELLNSTQLVPGRMLVHRLVVDRVNAALFDGPGELNSSGLPVLGRCVGLARQNFLGTDGQNTTIDLEVDVIVENGIELTWGASSAIGVIQVYYKPLD